MDEGETHLQSGHSGSERIKFQYIQGEKQSKNFASMSLSKDPHITAPSDESKVSTEYKTIIGNFIKRYYELLRAVSRKKISVVDFETLLIKARTLDDNKLSLFKKQVDTAIANGTVPKLIQRIMSENETIN